MEGGLNGILISTENNNNVLKLSRAGARDNFRTIFFVYLSACLPVGRAGWSLNNGLIVLN
jgi:hypothetical protein